MSFLNSDRKKDCDTGQNSASTFLIWQLYAFGRQGQQLIRESVAGGSTPPHQPPHWDRWHPVSPYQVQNVSFPLGYCFPIAEVTNYYKFSAWKQHKNLLFYSSAGQKSIISLTGQLSEQKSWCWQGCIPFGGSRICLLAFSASKGCLHSLAPGSTSLWSLLLS